MEKFTKEKGDKVKKKVEEWKLKNYVITYESWESYNAESEEEAIKQFRKDYPDEEMVSIEG